MGLEGTDTTITWSKFSKLRQSPVGKDYDAETVSGFNLKYAIVRKGNAIVVKDADVKVLMNTSESWAVNGKMNTYLLKHEQGHYDITVLAAKEFYKALLKLTAADENGLKDSIEKLNGDFQRKMDNSNIRYDEQTDHSKNKTAQEKWNKAIATEKQKPDGSIDNLP